MPVLPETMPMSMRVTGSAGFPKARFTDGGSRPHTPDRDCCRRPRWDAPAAAIIPYVPEQDIPVKGLQDEFMTACRAR